MTYPVRVETHGELSQEIVAWHVEHILLEDPADSRTRLGEPTLAKLLGRLGPDVVDRIYATEAVRAPERHDEDDDVFRLFRRLR
jgi:hypothetical protein